MLGAAWGLADAVGVQFLAHHLYAERVLAAVRTKLGDVAFFRNGRLGAVVDGRGDRGGGAIVAAQDHDGKEARAGHGHGGAAGLPMPARRRRQDSGTAADEGTLSATNAPPESSNSQIDHLLNCTVPASRRLPNSPSSFKSLLQHRPPPRSPCR